MHLRLKTLTAAICLLQRPTYAKAQKTTDSPTQLLFDYFKLRPTVATDDVTSSFIPQISEHIALMDVLLIILLISFFLFILYRTYKNLFPRHSFDLFIELGNQQTVVKIKLLTLPHDTTLYKFEAIRFVTSIAVIGFRKPKMHLIWPHFQATHTISNITYHLKEYYSLSYFTGFKLQEILNSSYYLILFTKGSDNQYRLVKLQYTNWQHVPPALPAVIQSNIISIYPPLPASLD